MLIAGLSEIFVLFSLGFAFRSNHQHGRSPLVYAALLTIMTAATMGLLRYLELADTQALHETLSFPSKHLVVACFLLGLLWHTLPRTAIAYALLALPITGFILNTITPIAIVSDAIIVSFTLYMAYSLSHNKTALIQVCAGLTALSSTLVWEMLIQDPSLLLGVFHLCLGSFFILISLASKNLSASKQL